MRKFYSVVLSIMLGAAAVAVGMGVFLKLANDDRKRLADVVSRSDQELKNARSAQELAVKEANKKLEAANAEVAKAQDIIKSLEQERDLISRAAVLPLPSAREIKGWKQAVNIALKTMVRFPPGNQIQTNDGSALTLVGDSPQSDKRWFSLTPYDARLELQMVQSLVTSTPVSYLADGRLLLGSRGTLDNQGDNILVLRVQNKGEPNLLIWARDPDGQQGGAESLKVLATLDFAE